jgi:hypothetical protein
MYLASRSIGYDVSWPNCEIPGPTRQFAVVGVTGGRPFTRNVCLRTEYAAARRTAPPQLYMNIAAPAPVGRATERTGPAGTCPSSRPLCRAYNYGYDAAEAAYAYALRTLGPTAVLTTWWLDVEFGGRWWASTSVNDHAIEGALAYLRGHHRTAGVYSTAYQWRVIAGHYRPGVPVWYATISRSAGAAWKRCSVASSFTGGPIRLVQYATGGLDADTAC